MKKYCPPGVFCIENTTLIFLLFIIIVSAFVIYHILSNHKILHKNIKSHKHNDFHMHVPNVIHHPSNIFLNPHAPPLKNNIYHPNNSTDIRGIPINIQTQSNNSTFSQIGILNRINGKETILPLMGKSLIANRNKFQYYTMSDKNSVKLPIVSNGKSSMNEYGINELYNGDVVYVQGYDDTFKITIYENNSIQYIPF